MKKEKNPKFEFFIWGFIIIILLSSVIVVHYIESQTEGTYFTYQSPDSAQQEEEIEDKEDFYPPIEEVPDNKEEQLTIEMPIDYNISKNPALKETVSKISKDEIELNYSFEDIDKKVIYREELENVTVTEELNISDKTPFKDKISSSAKISEEDYRLIESRIENLVNKIREQQGLDQLKFDKELSEIARFHSIDMATRDFYSHENPEGKNPQDRISDFNYSCKKEVGESVLDFGISENINRVYTFHSCYQTFEQDNCEGLDCCYEFNWKSGEEIAIQVVEEWINSPAHRNNIIDDHFEKQGVGLAFNEEKEVYITQKLC